MIDDENIDYEGQENTNMDWKKKGFDKHERLTLKINMEEAIRRNANKKIQTFTAKKTKPIKKASKKLKNKIKTSIYDDDEDEEDYILTPAFNNLQRFSLEQLLTPKEKKQLEKMETEQNLTPPEKLQTQQIVNDYIKNKENIQQKENIIKKEKLQNTDKSNSNAETIKGVFAEKEEKALEENKIEPKITDNKENTQDSSIFDNKETKQDRSIDDLLNDTDKQENQTDMRSLILEKSGRTKSQNQRKENHYEKNSKEMDFKNIKDAKEHER